ncbi:MAG: hypothetical protein HC846_03095 [Blastocatellia bacterium]|nr:hypothetical protein [Blastocatellia bacterium]
MGILILQYLTGGAWGVVIRRIAEAGSRTIWFVALLFLPIMAGISIIYPWAVYPTEKIVEWRHIYLNPTSFGLRAILYFAIWFVMSYLLNKWSAQQDTADNPEDAAKFLGNATAFSGPTMVVFALVVSFAAIDWVMTLDIHWFSTIWGFLYLIGWGLSAFAFIIALLANLIDKEPFNRVLGKKHFHDIGKLMLACVMVWTYFNLSQFLIIYSGNIPEETPWYLARMKNGWQYVGLLLILFHFAFPFLILLSRDIKRNSKWLSSLAIFILVMRLIDMYYHIGPQPFVGHVHEYNAFNPSWLDFAAPIAVGGLWLWWFFGELKKRPLLPPKDPFVENAIKHGQGH